MSIEGFWPTLLVGVVGAVFSEALRLVGLLKHGEFPTPAEWVVSAIYVLMGAGVVLLGTEKRLGIEVAALGAAFPAVFAHAVRSAGQSSPRSKVTHKAAKDHGRRTLGDYAASQF
jgi:uncharacterized membrane protein YeaQ/YmgE (transglycosylase-associated protein family)